jgi:hypothetical protein
MTVVPSLKVQQEKIQVCVRQMTLDDIPAVLGLQRRAFAGVTISGTAEKLTSQITVFPDGQHVAADETGRILGSSSTLIIDWDDYAQSARWSEITDRDV